MPARSWDAVCDGSFEKLCAANPAIDVLDADRDVLHLEIDDPDPTAVVIRVWVDAGGDPVP